MGKGDEQKSCDAVFRDAVPFTPSPRWGEGGMRALRRCDTGSSLPPHPTLSNRSRIYPTSAMFRGEVGQARLRAGRGSETPCPPPIIATVYPAANHVCMPCPKGKPMLTRNNLQPTQEIPIWGARPH